LQDNNGSGGHAVIEEEIETDIDLTSCLNDPSRESLGIKSKKLLPTTPLNLEIKSPWTILEKQS
jgi:hypothetical protein